MDILPVLCFLFGIVLASGLVARTPMESTFTGSHVPRRLTRIFTAAIAAPGSHPLVQRIWQMESRKMGLFGLFFFVLAIVYSLGKPHNDISISTFLLNAFFILEPGILLLLKADSPLTGDRELP